MASEAHPPSVPPADAEPETQHGAAAEAGPERTAGDDLAAGLDLMLRAARKALRNIEPTRLEELGKRAMRSVENLDAKKVSEFGKKAAKNLDPRKIEEVAEEAGRELLSVIERVAERVEDMIAPRPGKGAAEPPTDTPEDKPRVRVDEGSS